MKYIVLSICKAIYILTLIQGTNARKVNCGRVYSAYILKPVLSGRNLYPRKIKAFNFHNFENLHNSFP